jgi:hypothetical protein
MFVYLVWERPADSFSAGACLHGVYRTQEAAQRTVDDINRDYMRSANLERMNLLD